MEESDGGEQLAAACCAWMQERDHALQCLGIVIDEVGPGRARMRMQVRRDLLNSQAMCHGGMIFALADCAFAYSCNARNALTVAAGCSIDYLLPARAGDELTAVAEERSLRGRTGLYDVTVSNQAGDVVAHFRGRSHRVGGAVVRDGCSEAREDARNAGG